ncbi:hypothetical protein KDN24_02360 [Bacillus sp. Bva_UNVM-123]|uniref:hypothetical protein n=1 Tax=Bacillus sp. Bva_UNVM-123 TaxID=2829798 RepID=UPI00391F875F
MPAISKVRLTNVVYEEGNKRYNDEVFLFDGHNGAILLENGGGKTVLIQTALQAILPHTDLADRKIKTTLILENAPAHIAIEWITNDSPRRYVVTAVSLFTTKQGLDSLRYVYEYDANDANGIEGIPFVREGKEGKRTAERGEMVDYYGQMRDKTFSAQTFPTMKEYKAYLEEQYHIISSEWESIAKINSSEGGVEVFFDECKSTNQLFDRLLIPTVESSIVGHDTEMFVNMFEQQHESFKNYKRLKDTIEENKQISQQLEDYAGTYEKLHKLEEEYEKTKQRAKGAWNETISEKQKFMEEQMATIEKHKEWESSSNAYHVKAASYEIFADDILFKHLEADYLEGLAELTEHEEMLKTYSKDYYSLKLAELRLVHKEQTDTLSQVEEELDKIAQTDDAVDYENQLEESKQALLGWFLSKMEGLEKDRHGLRFQLNPILHEIQQAENSNKALAEEEKTLREVLSKSVSVIDTRTKDIERLKQQLLANPDQEQVKEEWNKWQVRTLFLDEEIIRLQQELKRFTLEEQEAEGRRDELHNAQSKTVIEMNKTVNELSNKENAEKLLIEKLATLRPQWLKLENIHLSQDSVEKRLIEPIDNFVKEKNKLLHRERVAYRFEDDYGEQATFFSDPFLAKQVASWKNQVDFLATGVEYVQMLENSEKEKWLQYPLWPITLVTTNKAKMKVIEKLKHVCDQLQFPIQVISTEEALSIHKEASSTSNQWISPRHWHNNMDSLSFAEWKEQIGAYAKEMTLLREQKEKETKQWEAVLHAFDQFLTTFPYEQITVLQEKHTQLKNQLAELKAAEQKEKDLIEEFRLKKLRNQQTSEQYRDEKQGLDGKIEKGIQYFQIEKEIEEEQKKANEVSERLQVITRELTALKRQLKNLTEERNQLQERENNIIAQLSVMKQDEEYKSLNGLTPIFTNESSKSIKDKILTTEMKLHKINIAQGVWITKWDAATEMIKQLNSQMNELQKEHSYIDEARDFPGDGKQLLQTICKQITTAKEKIDKLTTAVKEKSTKQDKQRGKCETKIEQFKRNFPNTEIVLFNDSLEEIQIELTTEKESLAQRKDYITQELRRIEKELKAVEQAKLGLDLFVEAHHFNAPYVVPLSVHLEEKLAFTYNRKAFVESITDELKRNKTLVEKERVKVERAKRKFRDFCLNHITDMKLQQMAINGVEHKQQYEDILDFKKNMLLRIEKITNYANEYIRKSDEDLQLFINQIHSHLMNLVEELKQIPKKTKVKVLDDWKQIFSFTIPEWDEEVGKMRIRDYIEWILQQLESERFMNEHGVQDNSKARKELEMWLHSKQLLRWVMNNEVMKVSCRKVTNDNKVTTRSYSWEQSNVWSGGEKWSKNMTLFLGILKFVAEKKKHSPSNMKRHRSVILDNPFGKASSGHVLSPVFFVAEQLGFQIIALTAHAEGKFLQDYFPVIYSCRLRASADPSKKVMTKEKWLHHAYFQDHEPKILDRLGEIEQLALFE